MYFILLVLHSLFRWLVLCSLVYAIYMAIRGIARKQKFTPRVNAVRQWTAALTHLQLLVGMILYFQSPVVKVRMPDNPALLFNEQLFFQSVHSSLMFVAVIIITIGSARAKKLSADQDKYRTILRWFSLALVIILIAIPWPFSPFAHRPYWRAF